MLLGVVLTLKQMGSPVLGNFSTSSGVFDWYGDLIT